MNLQKQQLLFAISGYKHTGKTTLIDKLIPLLKARGYKVAVIKHDGHDFEGDVPGTDSYKHHQAGAYGSAVFSGKRVLIQKEFEEEGEDAAEDAAGAEANEETRKASNHRERLSEKQEQMARTIAQAFPEADIILLEGFKNCSFPQYRCNYPQEPVIEAEKLADQICEMMRNYRNDAELQE